MTDTLTDRYVWAVQRSLPERQREDIDRELRGTIADTIDGKIEAGTDPAAAEREVITELGDPYRLAAGYADRPLHLIGPALFPDYVRLLKVLYVIVLPIVFVAILIGQLIGQPESPGGAIGTSVAVVIGVIVHIGFWTTLVFALVERSSTYKGLPWDPKSLPQLPAGGQVKLSDTLGSVIWTAIVFGGVIWAQFFSLYRDADGGVIPVLDPGLWSFWLPYFLVLAVFDLSLKVVLFGRRNWSFPLAGLNLVAAVAFTIPALWLLLEERIMNPEFLDRAGIAEVFDRGGAGVIVAIVIVLSAAATTVVDGFVKASRASRAA